MDLRVQLKVCEGCGCLWYRAQNRRGVYCFGCDVKLREFPRAESRRRRGPQRETTLARVWGVDEHPTNEDLFVHPMQQNQLHGDPGFVGTPDDHPSDEDPLLGTLEAGAGGVA